MFFGKSHYKGGGAGGEADGEPLCELVKNKPKKSPDTAHLGQHILHSRWPTRGSWEISQ